MKPTIHSFQNEKIKAAIRLHEGGHRRKTGRFLIDGVRETARALDAGIAIEQAFFDGKVVQTPAGSAVSLLIERFPGDALQPVDSAVLDKLSYGQRASEIVCVAVAPPLELDRLRIPSTPLMLVIDRIEKPGNLGAILRTADAVGVSGVILNNPVCEILNPNAIRASLGTIFTLPIAVAQTHQSYSLLRKLGCRIFATRVDAKQAFWEADYRGSVAILLGSEARGLGADWADSQCQSIAIPMFGQADSLNVSSSSAIVLYEALRQRRH